MPNNPTREPAASAAHSLPSPLEGAPRHEYETRNLTMQDVRDALRRAARSSQDFADLVAITDAMLVRLDTIRDECSFTSQLGRDAADRGDFSQARERFHRIVVMTGRPNDVHELHVRATPNSPSGESLDSCQKTGGEQ